MIEYNGEALKDILKQKNVTQIKLAEKLGIDKRTVCIKINGKVGWTLYEAIKICNFLGIDSLERVFVKKKEQTD